MHRAMLILIVLFLGATGASLVPRSHPPHAAHREIAVAAKAFLDSLPQDLRSKAGMSFDHAGRLDWHFVPRDRPGITFGQLSDTQRTALQNLLRSALSSQGVLKVNSLLELENVLKELEGGSAARDPGKYSVAIYGDPAGAKPWGWKVEGHHLSLNFTSDGSEIIGITPAFIGANPATVPHGPKAGQRLLANEEDLARKLLGMLDDAQRKTAIFSDKALPEVILGPGRGFDDAPAVGLAAEKMTQEERAVLWQLIEEFAHNYRKELADVEIERIHTSGVEKIHFAWAGSTKPGEGHYYRVRGPTFVIEYDNTQNDANHVHTLWHDLTRDFGQDALKEHYQKDHK